MSIESDIEQLATWIMENVPGEPSRSESAVAVALRLLRAWQPDPEIAALIVQWNMGAYWLSETGKDGIQESLERRGPWYRDMNKQQQEKFLDQVYEVIFG